ERAAVLIESGRASIPKQVVAGFYDMTGAQLRLLHALESAGKISAIFVPVGEGDAYAFASRFLTELPATTKAAAEPPHSEKNQYENKESELRAVCRSIRDLIDAGTTADRIGITTRA